jgi:hypothetical protein
MSWDDPKWDKNNPVVPFQTSPNGMVKMLTYGYSYSTVEWRLLMPFAAKLKYVDYSHGRSAMTFWMKDINTNIIYPITLKTMHSLLLNNKLTGSTTPVMNWKAMKVGSNYQLQLA